MAERRKRAYVRPAWARIPVWIEDRDGVWGSIEVKIRRDAAVGELRRRAARLGVAARLQRWVVGGTLCADDKTLLRDLAGPYLTSKFHLFIVDDTLPESSSSIITPTSQNNNNIENALPESEREDISEVYNELMNLEQQALIPNAEAFECEVCAAECPAGRGVTLRECLHAFCRDCLADVIRHSAEPTVCCPSCPGTLQQREIRALVPAQEHARWLARGLAAAESRARDARHCRTPDCAGWVFCEPEVEQYNCPVCMCTNCVPCKAIHEGENCQQYRARLNQPESETRTKALLESLLSQGNALKCPGCNAIISKAVGCDWIQCPACSTEICWATRGPRWGPGGRGDTSGGCRCRVNGRRCHRSCGNCH